MRFYYVSSNGELVASKDVNEFIDIYSKAYFTWVPYGFELETMKILTKSKYSSDDAIQIMRWKLNDYKGKLYVNDRLKIPRTKFVFGNDVWNKIVAVKDQYNSSKNEKEVFRELTKNDGIGTVYALTILFFITGGQSPIYDRFARLALETISDDKNIEYYADLKFKEPPDKQSIDAVFNMLDKYKGKLTEIFGTAWKDNRSIDRALWSYGHFISCYMKQL